MIRRFLLLLVSLTLAACSGGGGGGDSSPAPPTGSAPQRLASSITSVQTGMNYSLQIYLPEGYATGTTRYPVIYAADAEWRFTVLAEILERQRRPAILVAVGNMGGERRWVDFIMPGVEAYHRFLARELVPMVESTYRADPSQRVLTGHSLSGEMVMYALLLDRLGDRAFHAYISEEGGFWWGTNRSLVGGPTTGQPGATMEAEMFARDRNLPVTLVMAGDARGNSPRVTAMHDHMAQRGYTGLRLAHYTYNLGHLPSDGPAFTDALQLIFGPPP